MTPSRGEPRRRRTPRRARESRPGPRGSPRHRPRGGCRLCGSGGCAGIAALRRRSRCLSSSPGRRRRSGSRDRSSPRSYALAYVMLSRDRIEDRVLVGELRRGSRRGSVTAEVAPQGSRGRRSSRGGVVDLRPEQDRLHVGGEHRPRRARPGWRPARRLRTRRPGAGSSGWRTSTTYSSAGVTSPARLAAATGAARRRGRGQGLRRAPAAARRPALPRPGSADLRSSRRRTPRRPGVSRRLPARRHGSAVGLKHLAVVAAERHHAVAACVACASRRGRP